jgi:protein-S-isoprenylcysteine O-methyltransferase Ste14
MTCRLCGTVIADNAIICYRCGHATNDPVRRPPAAGRRRRGAPPGILLVALLALVLAGLTLGQAGDPGWPRLVGWVLAGLAAVLIVWRWWRR